MLTQLGNRLRQHRIDMNEPQMEFAKRIGVSVPTYRKMEHGSATVPIGYWARVLQVLSCLEQMEAILKPEFSTDRWTNPRTQNARLRVRRRTAVRSPNSVRAQNLASRKAAK